VRQASSYAAVAVALLCALGTLSCIPALNVETVRSAPRPAIGARVETLHEVQKPPPELVANVSGNTIDVQLQQPFQCRDVTSTKMLKDVEIKRSVSSAAQWTNVATAILLGGVGAYVAFAPCTNTQTDSMTGQQTDQPCSASDASTRHTVGYVLLGTAILPTAALVYNAIRAHDDRTVERVAPLLTPAEWRACGAKPMADEEVVATIGSTTLQGTTGPDGHATIDVSSVQPAPGIVHDHRVTIRRAGSEDAMVDLESMPVFATWKASVEAAEAQERQERDQQDARRQAEAERANAERNARRQALRTACDRNNAQSCYKLGEDVGGSAGRDLIQKSCELDYQAGCILYRNIVSEMEQGRAERQRALAARQAEAEEPRNSGGGPAIRTCLRDCQNCNGTLNSLCIRLGASCGECRDGCEARCQNLCQRGTIDGPCE
jgi:hypothetical protein